MKTVAKYLSPEEAMVARSLLQAYDIPAFLPGSEVLGNLPYLAFGTSGYQLMVMDDDYDSALALLKNPPKAEEEPHTEEE